MINSTNFHLATTVNWTSIGYAGALAILAPDGTPRPADYISDSGSRYWYTETGVVRMSNHWGPVATCRWYLDGKAAFACVGEQMLFGFASWNSFSN